MYKIFTLVRNGSKPLWTPHMIETDVIVIPAVIDPDTGEVITPAVTEKKTVEYESETLEAVEKTVKEMLITIPSGQIRVVEDLTYTLDILFAV